MEKINSYMVSTRCMTYNQAQYIEDTLHGFAIQETSFPAVYIVIDDASTDGEQEIIKKWADKHLNSNEGSVIWHELPYGMLTVAGLIDKPHSTFVLLLLKENHYQVGRAHDRLNYVAKWNENAKYLAMCEGDDYWSEPAKLQKQVDYLEEHPYITYSCTRYRVLNQSSGDEKLAANYFFDDAKNTSKQVFEFSREDVFRHSWFTKTLTCVYRRDCEDNSVARYFNYYRDVHRVYLLLSKGKGVCHSFVGGVYRKNETSIFGGKNPLEQIKQNYLVYEELYRYTGDKLMKKIAASFYVKLFKNNYESYGKPQSSIQYYAILWYRPVLFLKTKIKELLQEYL